MSKSLRKSKCGTLLKITHSEGKGVLGPTWNPLVLHRSSFVTEEEE